MSNNTTLPASIPMLNLIILWKRKSFAIRLGTYGAIAALVFFIMTSWKVTYEAAVRIEPELTTTGETTSIESEMDVVQSWATVAETVQKMARNVIVTPTSSASWVHFNYYLYCIKSILSDSPYVDFSDFQPALHLDHFVISGSEEGLYLKKRFILKVGSNNDYTLYDGANELAHATSGNLETIPLGQTGTTTLEVRINTTSAHPGDTYVLSSIAPDLFTDSIQKSMKVERKGFREHSGLMIISYGNTDPVLAEQVLKTLVDVYTAQAYDRSSLGKIAGLRKLEDESKKLRVQLAEAENALDNYKEKNQITDLSKEQDMAYRSMTEITQELRKAIASQEGVGVTVTHDHPSMIVLRKQTDYLERQLKDVKAKLDIMPQKERELNPLQNNYDIIKTMLDQNTLFAAQLRPQVETITGYAHLVSLYVYRVVPYTLRGVLTIMLGYIVGALMAATWIMRDASPLFARVRYKEDLTAAMPLPVVAKLPLKRRSIWWFQFDKSTVTTARQWKKMATVEIEHLEREIPFLLSPSANKTMLFASYDGNFGVPFCACKLAVASAANKHKTLLIDGNIMRPGLQEEFKCNPRPGLTDVLIGQAQISEALQTTDALNLTLLSAGSQTSNFRLLEDATRIGTLLTQLSTMFDRIIVEFPPLDASLCQKGVLGAFDAVFLVVKRDTSVRKLAEDINATKLAQHPAAFYILNKG